MGKVIITDQKTLKVKTQNLSFGKTLILFFRRIRVREGAGGVIRLLVDLRARWRVETLETIGFGRIFTCQRAFLSGILGPTLTL